jgi:hypothetical protein
LESEHQQRRLVGMTAVQEVTNEGANYFILTRCLHPFFKTKIIFSTVLPSIGSVTQGLFCFDNSSWREISFTNLAHVNFPETGKRWGWESPGPADYEDHRPNDARP